MLNRASLGDVSVGAERVQMVLGGVVRAEQRLAWAKVLTRLGAAANIQAVLSAEHGREIPRLVGELLLTAAVGTSELIIARTEMQVGMSSRSPSLRRISGID